MRNHPLFFFDLHKTKFERRLAPENLDHDFQLALLGVHLFDDTREATERAFRNLYCLVDLERNDYLVDDFGLFGITEHTVDF